MEDNIVLVDLPHPPTEKNTKYNEKGFICSVESYLSIIYTLVLFPDYYLARSICYPLMYLTILSCSDGETFISADDLRINLWNLEISNQSFNIVDVKPTNMEDLTGRTCSTMIRIPCFSDFNCFDFMACVKIVIKRINGSLSRIGAGYTNPGLSSVISCIIFPLKKLAVLTFYLPSMLEDFNV